MAITSFHGKYRFLSNFYPSKITFRMEQFPGKTFHADTVEHAYQASKCRVESAARHILENDWTPGQVKRIGLKVDLRDHWEQAKIRVMRNLLARKFTRENTFGESLLLTEGQLLVEGNTWGDTFWGICNGKGDNWLGHLLMARRAEIGGS